MCAWWLGAAAIKALDAAEGVEIGASIGATVGAEERRESEGRRRGLLNFVFL